MDNVLTKPLWSNGCHTFRRQIFPLQIVLMQKKCSHHANFVTKNISLCGWGEANAYWRQCGEKVIDDNYKDFKTTVGFKRPCQILEYSGQLNFDKPRADKDTIFLKFQFSPPVMTVFYQERLVFDTVGMLGSIGGTLGMCIGFSFSGWNLTFEFFQIHWNQ